MSLYILIGHHHDTPLNVAPGSWNCFTFKATILKAFNLSPPILIQAEEDLGHNLEITRQRRRTRESSFDQKSSREKNSKSGSLRFFFLRCHKIFLIFGCTQKKTSAVFFCDDKEEEGQLS